MHDTTAPRRPRLADTLDPRDWRSYFTCAFETPDRRQESACLYWAERLEPEAPETPFLRWALSEEKDTAALLRAMDLDPFVFIARIVRIQSKPGIFTPLGRRAWISLRAGDHHRASGEYLRYLARTPGDLQARWELALAYHYRGRPESAAVHIGVLLDTIRARREQRTASYLSLEFLEWARGRALQLAKDRAGAQAAHERALEENLVFHQARIALVELALQRGDTAAASDHWRQILELAPASPLVDARHARYLARVRRREDAVKAFERVVAAEPHWVAVRRELAVVLDSAGAGRRADAIAAHEAYLARAPRQPAAPREAAAARLLRLRTGGDSARPKPVVGTVRVPG